MSAAALQTFSPRVADNDVENTVSMNFPVYAIFFLARQRSGEGCQLASNSQE